MTGLLLILTEADGDRAAAALELAAASAALGRPVAVLLRGPAAKAVADSAGAGAIGMLRELGAEIGICQTAMAAHGMLASDLPPGVEPLGMVAFLGARGDWQVVIA